MRINTFWYSKRLVVCMSLKCLFNLSHHKMNSLIAYDFQNIPLFLGWYKFELQYKTCLPKCSAGYRSLEIIKSILFLLFLIFMFKQFYK